MTSDRARVTYDPSRYYTGVIAQQGRVSLDADWNEAQAIGSEQLEARTLDLVGPLASPDQGYAGGDGGIGPGIGQREGGAGADRIRGGQGVAAR